MIMKTSTLRLIEALCASLVPLVLRRSSLAIFEAHWEILLFLGKKSAFVEPL